MIIVVMKMMMKKMPEDALLHMQQYHIYLTYLVILTHHITFKNTVWLFLSDIKYLCSYFTMEELSARYFFWLLQCSSSFSISSK